MLAGLWCLLVDPHKDFGSRVDSEVMNSSSSAVLGLLYPTEDFLILCPHPRCLRNTARLHREIGVNTHGAFRGQVSYKIKVGSALDHTRAEGWRKVCGISAHPKPHSGEGGRGAHTGFIF